MRVHFAGTSRKCGANKMWPALLIIALISLFFYYNNKNKYWKNRGVTGPKPAIFVGNFSSLLARTENLDQVYISIYNQFDREAYVGAYKMSQPVLLIREPSLVSRVLIKDFQHFENNEFNTTEDVDPLFGRNLFVIGGEKWKNTRRLLSPSFTNGRMKMLFPMVEEVSKHMVKYIERTLGTTLESKNLSTRFTTDNVATCAFGLDAHSFDNPKAEFPRMSSKIFVVPASSFIKIIVTSLQPTLTNWLRLRVVPRESEEYFISIVRQALKYRAENNIVRNDNLDMMRQLQAKLGANFTDIDVTAHSVGFLIDGLETTSTTLNFALYNIARHPEVQDKLRKDINEAVERTGGEFSYEALQDMKYLDMVLNESMRMHPAVPVFMKICTKDYNLADSDGNPANLAVERGTPVIIPVFGLHSDEKYFPDPRRFDPERFSEENKANIKNGSFLPFGDGPRICIGRKFGLLQMKMGVVSILRNFTITVNKKTVEPIKMDLNTFFAGVAGGLWLDFQKI